MALASTGVWTARFKIRGISNRVSTFTAKGSFADYATASTALGTLITALDAVCDGAIYGMTLSEEYEDAAAGYGSVSVSERAILRGVADGTTKPVTVQWPAPAVAVRQDTTGEDYNQLDLTASEITTFWAQFAAAGWEVSDGEHVAVTGGNPRGGRVVASGAVP